MTTTAHRSDPFIRERVKLRYRNGKAEVPYIRGAWYDAFMFTLSQNGFGGVIEWSYPWGDGNFAVALTHYAHFDNAVRLITDFATNGLFNRNDGWAYDWRERYGQLPAETMLRSMYLENHVVIVDDGVQRNLLHPFDGWALVMPALDTHELSTVRHQLPRTVESYMRPPRPVPAQEVF